MLTPPRNGPCVALRPPSGKAATGGAEGKAFQRVRVQPACTEKDNNSRGVVRAQKEQTQTVGKGLRSVCVDGQRERPQDIMTCPVMSEPLPRRPPRTACPLEAEPSSAHPPRCGRGSWAGDRNGPLPWAGRQSVLTGQPGMRVRALPGSAPGPLPESQGPCGFRPAHGTPRLTPPHPEGFDGTKRAQGHQPWEAAPGGPRMCTRGSKHQDRTERPSSTPQPQSSALLLWKWPPRGQTCRKSHEKQGGMPVAGGAPLPLPRTVLLHRGAGRSGSRLLRHSQEKDYRKTPGLQKQDP